ncbi:hypothetical protein [Corynebacterium lujinxingii]|uniref:DUF2567 domain-containing protein n=1 Tax=Corynebacterium lujinxingii TaxID=2763010 RepID=A0A7H0JX32_9CORY|nr:hypothetical protein [Corynebacterium lujinxingii]MBC3177980.1 hypothetical protein [Corynebacterium lujinxingii]NNO09777.1 hypothetical protein [Corynebacterium lujinxingii]QNP89598.1 hypothetical protein IAU68_07770 [Corynebacterium lujinxingii]
MIGSGAGLLALALLLGIGAGFAWGALRPAYVGEVSDGGAVIDQAASPANVQFTGFAWFVILAALLGLVVGIVAWRAVGRKRFRGGVWWMVWAMVVAALGSIAVYLFGNWFALRLTPVPDHDALSDGAQFSLVPPIAPGAAWAVAPLVAGLVYWFANLAAYTRERDEISEVATLSA